MDNHEALDDQKVKVKISTIVAAILLAINVLLLGPGSWLITTWKEHYDKRIDTLYKDLHIEEKKSSDIRNIIYNGYLSKESYRDDKNLLEKRFSSLQTQIISVSLALSCLDNKKQ